MKSTNIVISHQINQDVLNEIQVFRETRLKLAESMLNDFDAVVVSIKDKGILEGDLSPSEILELRGELEEKVQMLKTRMENSDFIFEDELHLYSELIDEASV